MARKNAQSPQFEGMQDDTPPELIEMALELKKCQTSEAKAKAKTKTAQQDLMSKMEELERDSFRVEINGVYKIVRITDKKSVRFDKSETAPEAGGE